MHNVESNAVDKRNTFTEPTGPRGRYLSWWWSICIYFSFSPFAFQMLFLCWNFITILRELSGWIVWKYFFYFPFSLNTTGPKISLGAIENLPLYLKIHFHKSTNLNYHFKVFSTASHWVLDKVRKILILKFRHTNFCIYYYFVYIPHLNIKHLSYR